MDTQITHISLALLQCKNDDLVLYEQYIKRSLDLAKWQRKISNEFLQGINLFGTDGLIKQFQKDPEIINTLLKMNLQIANTLENLITSILIQKQTVSNSKTTNTFGKN